MLHVTSRAVAHSVSLALLHRIRLCFLLGSLVLLAIVQSAQAADRGKLAAFLNVTGFDVALDSLRLSASAAPAMVGVKPGDFGSEWTRLADQVFDTDLMRGMAVDILSQTLSDELLSHAAAFYASDLGQRLVEAENVSHMMDDTEKQAEGRNLVAEMVRDGAPRLEIFKRMNRSIDATGQSTRALQEVQYRFLLAASAAGVVELRMDPGELRAYLKAQEPQLRMAIQESALAGAAYTYRAFSDADVEAYVAALEEPRMQQVYELMNAVQYTILGDRFEVLAAKMAGLRAGQDI